MITANPLLFPPDLTENLVSQQDFIKYIDGKIIELPKFVDNLKTCKTYLEKGGEIEVEIPAFAHIKSAIDKNQPVLALLYAQALGSTEGWYHYVVVSGYDNSRVFANNSNPTSQKQAWFPVERFLYAVHASSVGGIDNASLLIVSNG